MEKIFVYDINHNRVQVDLVKFFKYQYTNYFLYTINEKDEKNFVKLYVVKVMKELGEWISCNIIDDEEWKDFQIIIKNILKEIKDNKIVSFSELESSILYDMNIKEARHFKLDVKLVDMLVSNVYEEQNNFQSMYIDIKKQKDSLDEILAKMLGELTEYRLKYGELENSNQNFDFPIADFDEPKSETDYKNLYLKTKYEKEYLDVVLAKMLGELTEYHLKYDELKS